MASIPVRGTRRILSRHVALVVDLTDRRRDIYLLKSDAAALHAKRLIQKLSGEAAYCAPRNWRQIAHGITPPLHPDVLAVAVTTTRNSNVPQ